jgi:hypothetical protein
MEAPAMAGAWEKRCMAGQSGFPRQFFASKFISVKGMQATEHTFAVGYRTGNLNRVHLLF